MKDDSISHNYMDYKYISNDGRLGGLGHHRMRGGMNAQTSVHMSTHKSVHIAVRMARWHLGVPHGRSDETKAV